MSNTRFAKVLEARLTRRQVLRGMASMAALGIVGCGSPRPGGQAVQSAAAGTTLGFEEVTHTVDPTHAVPRSYSAQVLLRWGDPILVVAPPRAGAGPRPSTRPCALPGRSPSSWAIRGIRPRAPSTTRR